MQDLVSQLIRRELHELQYKWVEEWFAYLDRTIRLGVITANESSRLAELKATRNVRAHNAGIANEIYVRKSGQLARAKAGEPLSMPTARLTRAVLEIAAAA
jgi:hypothetical protein